MTGIRVDNIGDAQWILPRRSVSQALWPGYLPPHVYKLLGDVIWGLCMRCAVQRAQYHEDGQGNCFFIAFNSPMDVSSFTFKLNLRLRGSIITISRLPRSLYVCDCAKLAPTHMKERR